MMGTDLSEMPEAVKQAIMAALDKVKAQMQGHMAEGNGEEEMSDDVLSDAISDASEPVETEIEIKAEPKGEEAMEMEDDMRRLMQGPLPKQSRAKMAMIAGPKKMEKPGKKFGKV